MGLIPRAGSSPAFGTIMFTVYAIKSIEHNFTYVGMTEKLEDRLKRHNSGFVRSTKNFAPFFLFYTEHYPTGKQAREREKFLKSTSGKRFLKSILASLNNNNEIGR